MIEPTEVKVQPVDLAGKQEIPIANPEINKTENVPVSNTNNVYSEKNVLKSEVAPVVDIASSASLNVKIFGILPALNETKSILIKTELPCGNAVCMSKRNFSVYEKKGETVGKLLFTSSEDSDCCAGDGYMLIYKNESGNVFGSLGYNFKKNCCCCGDCFSECCKCESKSCCCSCCDGCCTNGGCFLGGCCINAGCCCCCDEPCIEKGGICTCCNCFCFKGGCCHSPCCEDGCCPCPDFKHILLDLRFLNTIEEAYQLNAGVYVGTITSSVECFQASSYDYIKAGERFSIQDVCCGGSAYEMKIADKQTKEEQGKINCTVPLFCGEELFDVVFPETATPLEKLMIISSLLMMDYNKCNALFPKTKLITTKKRKTLPGLPADFM